ncbi:MAG: 2Fe-2S iron-sulfur cluster binding domain-containing protein, partial [Deltaproteobacteria bacterium]|nr:2Fe-2S iron-sulfur cluster binding domain-containing protein [Deltaproteobacteria bacterium]
MLKTPAMKKFKVRFENPVSDVEVDPKQVPYGPTGKPGSILDIALGGGINLQHACGGVCACSTCHVYVKEGLDSCSPATEAELDMLENAPDLKPNSRLGCQCVPNGNQNLVIEIPGWNRNQAGDNKQANLD